MTPQRASKIADQIIGKSRYGLGRHYMYDNPCNLVFQDVSIIVPDYGEIWRGHLDVTISYKRIMRLSRKLGIPLALIKGYKYRKQMQSNEGYDLDQNYGLYLHNKDNKLTWMVNKQWNPYWYVKNGVPSHYTEEEYARYYPESIEAPMTDDDLDKTMYRKVRLPRLSRLKGYGMLSPYLQLQYYFVQKIGLKRAQKMMNLMRLRKDDYEQLETQSTKYYRQRFPGDHPLDIQEKVSWNNLSVAPCKFYGNPQWTKKGYGYIEIQRRQLKPVDPDQEV